MLIAALVLAFLLGASAQQCDVNVIQSCVTNFANQVHLTYLRVYNNYVVIIIII